MLSLWSFQTSHRERRMGRMETNMGISGSILYFTVIELFSRSPVLGVCLGSTVVNRVACKHHGANDIYFTWSMFS